MGFQGSHPRTSQPKSCTPPLRPKKFPGKFSEPKTAPFIFAGTHRKNFQDKTGRFFVQGWGAPIVLTLYGPDGEVALPLLPKRALTLAQELLTRGVHAIKADQWDTPPPA